MKMRFVGLAVLLASVLLAGCGGGENSTPTEMGERTTQSRPHAFASPQPQYAAADYNVTVQQFYVAYFGRPADSRGLANFTAQLAAIGAPTSIQDVSAAYGTNPTIRALIDSFGISTESNSLYGSGSTESFVFAIYQNVLNRAPDTDGFNFWVKAINDGGLSKGNAALSIMAGALANGTPQGQADAALIHKRIKLASDFTASLTTQAMIDTYSGDGAAAMARQMLITVTASTDAAIFPTLIAGTLNAMTTGIKPLPGSSEFPVRAALAAYFGAEHSFSGRYIEPTSGKAYDFAYKSVPGPEVMFQGKLAMSASVTYSMKQGGHTLLDDEVSTAYYQLDPFMPLGSMSPEGDYAVASDTHHLPTTAKAGDTGPFLTIKTYDGATKVWSGTATVITWEMQADTDSTAWFCTKATILLSRGGTKTSTTECYKLSKAGAVIGRRFEFPMGDTNFVFSN